MGAALDPVRVTGPPGPAEGLCDLQQVTGF